MGGVAGTGTAQRPRPLAGAVLLAAWEDGARCRPLFRPLALLAAALPGTDPAGLSALPVAERDLLLLRAREATFGAELGIFGRCAACGQALELMLRTPEVCSELADATAGPGPVEWAEGEHRYRLRPVTTDDLAATLAIADPQAAADLLLARCVEAADAGSSPAAPPGVPAVVADRFAELHAAAEVRCAIDCPDCGTHQVLDLDIGGYLWREVTVAARRLLAEVHLLARAYAWAERDILALTPARRAAYLELAGAG